MRMFYIRIYPASQPASQPAKSPPSLFVNRVKSGSTVPFGLPVWIVLSVSAGLNGASISLVSSVSVVPNVSGVFRGSIALRDPAGLPGSSEASSRLVERVERA